MHFFRKTLLQTLARALPAAAERAQSVYSFWLHRLKLGFPEMNLKIVFDSVLLNNNDDTTPHRKI